MNVAQFVEHGAHHFPDRLALHFEGQRWSYGQLHAESNRAANGFADLGIERGDRVAIWLPNTAAFVIAYFGIHKLGAVAVTINTALKTEEIQFILADSGATLLITSAALFATLSPDALRGVGHVVLIEGEAAGTIPFAALLDEAATTHRCAEVAPDDPALLLYTSGTTGFPKGALLSHGAVIIAAETAIPTFDLRPQDRVLLPLSIFHSFGQTAGMLPTLAAGATLLLHRQFEPKPVLAAVEEDAATVFFGVPTVYILLQAQATPDQLRSVRRYISAGAPLPVEVARRWQATHGVPINEGYGLTEICLGTFNHDPLTKPGSVGTPLTGVRLSIVDEAGVAVPSGESGEIVIETPSVMLGYWQRPEESAAVLRAGRFHTGDIGRMDADGYVYIVDRIKDMINVGGVKVYPSEVEQILYQHPAVSEAAVYGIPEAVLGEQVQASVVLKPDVVAHPPELIAFCRQRLAEFKVPSAIHLVDQLPKNRIGKILKRILREQGAGLQEAADSMQSAPRQSPLASSQQVQATTISHWMAGWLADQLGVDVAQIGWDTPFAEVGMTSVMAVNFARALGDWLGQPIEAILLWNFPTIRDVARHLSVVSTRPLNRAAGASSYDRQSEPIALIGIGCRFPGGADTPEKFWKLLHDGIDPVREIPASRWPVDDYYDPNPNVAGKMYVRAASLLDNVDQFDAQFFGISPLEAATLDPQQRLLLEVTWQALEDANLAADQIRESRTGVYVGAFWDDYSAANLYSAAADEVDSYRILSNLRGMTAGRLAYVLGLHGPAMQLDTACSSSLLAVHLACQSLRTGECDLALAGGVNLMLSPEQLIGLCHMGAVSPDGRCKSFAADADGFGIGEGVGVVVLKRLTDAVHDGDRILAVVRGSAVNHDGASNGLTAPNGRAQEAMLRQALDNAAVQPEQIQYVETHGTGTVLGDPIEIHALVNVLGQKRADPLLIGSVKSNIGHLSAAAGVAALIKVALALKEGEIPPNLHFTSPNPHIPWATAPLSVPTAPTAWPSAERRRAGISSFGLTGTNVHLIVEEAPPTQAKSARAAKETSTGSALPARNGTHETTLVSPAVERPLHLLPLSAKSEQTLAAQIDQMEAWVAAQPDSPDLLADICHTAATSRVHWNHRLSILAPDLATLRARLQQAKFDTHAPGIIHHQKGEAERNSRVAPRLAFLFAGQGPQYADMGRQLYATQPLFRRTLDQCDEILRAHLDRSLLEILYGDDKTQADALLNEATYAQPALFAVEYALATLWRSWGVEPSVVIGHSLGEYAAACVAGVFSLEDGLKLVATRGRLMQREAPKGQMVAVLGAEAEVRQILAPYAQMVSLAAINTPQSLVIAGAPDAIQAASQDLGRAGIDIRPLRIYVASHSPLMEPILDEFEAVARTVNFQHARLPVISNVTGALADEALGSPHYWRRHLREPVQFARGMTTLADLGIDTFIEAGPKATLLGLGQQCLPESNARFWLPSIHPKIGEWNQLLESLAVLYGRGAAIDWRGFDQDYPRAKVTLPGYPFQRQRYWIDERGAKVEGRRGKDRGENHTSHFPLPTSPSHPLLGRQLQSVLAARSQERLFESRVDLDALPYLADHTVFDQILVPGAAYFETILAAAAQLWPQRPPILADCAIQQGMVLPSAEQTGNEAAGATAQIVFTPMDGGYQWQIYSLIDGDQPIDGWTLHASGTVTPGQPRPHPDPMDLATVRAHCPTPIDRDRYDQQFREQGISYGPDFQALTQLFVGDGEALGYVALPPTLIATAGDYQLHPVLLDAALRVSSCLLPAGESDPYLPFGVERLELYKPGVYTRLWSYVQKRAALPDSQQVDITLIDEEGDVVAQFTNFTLRRASRQRMMGHQRRLDWLYELAWKPVTRAEESPFAHDAGRWIILADRQGMGAELAARLEAQGEMCLLLYQAALAEAGGDVASFMRLLQAYRHLSPTPVRGVIYLWALDTQEGADEDAPTAAFETSSQCLHLAQALLVEDLSPRLWIVTRQAVGMAGDSVHLPQSPLWGIGRTLHWEQPELACTLVDLRAEAGAPALFEEIWYADGENQILLGGDERLAARLVRHRERTTQPLLLDAQSSYLVTGGLGGLGLEVAQWLVAQGARHLVLAGRRGATTAAAQTAIRAMEDAGAHIVVAHADIAERSDVVGLLAVCQATAPLRGIIHAAGIIDDGLLLQQTSARFAQVMAPKVTGSWHLHTLTRDLPLDFFVCFSSVSSLLGNSGQSNYAAANAFMDALAHQRRAKGRAALSINWGGWSDVGLAAELVKTTEASGLGAIAPGQGLDLLGVLLTHRAAQVGVLPIQWRRFQQELGHRSAFPLLHELLEQTTPQKGAASFRQQLAAVSAGERYGLVKTQVQDLTLKLLGRTPADDESFLLFGLDSLMSIQLANRLATALEISLPATLAFKYETVERLTAYLLDRVDESARAALNGSAVAPIVEPPRTLLTDWYPQLYNQRECYIWHETVENKACLHVQQCAYIHSPVDRQRLAAALQALVDRHEALRTVYTRRGEDLLQRTLAAQSVDFAAVDVADQPWSALVEPILAAAREPFNLEEGPVLRGRLYSRAEDEHLFLLVVHHIAADATALSVIINELWAIYGAISNGVEDALPPLSATWTDFVRWQTDLLQSDEGERLWRYWQDQMAGDLPQLNLPTDFPHPPKDSHHGRPAYFEIDAALIHQLRQLAQRKGCTLYMVLMAGFQLLLHRYTQQRDLIVMAHVANRNEIAFADMVGYLADTFPIRTRIAEDATFHSVLRQVQPTILGAMDHQGFPLRLLAERLHIEEDPTRPVLSPVWFTLLPLRLFQESGSLLQTGSGAINLGGLTLEATDLLPAWLGAWYDLEMILTEGEEVVFGTLVYKTDLFSEPTIQRMISDFRTVLQSVADDPEQAIGECQSDLNYHPIH